MTNSQTLPELKPDHEGVAPLPFGEHVWLLERNDGVLVEAFETRHDAIGYSATELQNQDWYEPICVRVGEVPLSDIRTYE